MSLGVRCFRGAWPGSCGGFFLLNGKDKGRGGGVGGLGGFPVCPSGACPGSRGRQEALKSNCSRAEEG